MLSGPCVLAAHRCGEAAADRLGPVGSEQWAREALQGLAFQKAAQLGCDGETALTAFLDVVMTGFSAKRAMPDRTGEKQA